MTESQIIGMAYDAGLEEECNRLINSDFGKIEFTLVKDLLDSYLKSGSKVIDIGCGPGMYTDYLLKKNCSIGLVDISCKSLEHARTEIPEHHKNRILFFLNRCASCLNEIADNEFEAALLMGPLYHISDKENREKAISECYRILKKGGIVLGTFMSPYPKLNVNIEADAQSLCDNKYLDNLMLNGITKTNFKGFEIPQFRCWPNAAVQQMEAAGFKKLKIRNIEGIASNFKHSDFIFFDPDKDKLLRTLLLTCDNPDLSGITHQYIFVGEK